MAQSMGMTGQGWRRENSGPAGSWRRAWTGRPGHQEGGRSEGRHDGEGEGGDSIPFSDRSCPDVSRLIRPAAGSFGDSEPHGTAAQSLGNGDGGGGGASGRGSRGRNSRER